MLTHINEIAEAAHNNAKEKGFWEEGQNIPKHLLLIISELTEAMEADRKNKFSVCGSLTKAAAEIYPDRNLELIAIEEPTLFAKLFEEHVKDTFEDELADSLIRILDLCASRNIDIKWHINMKMHYNNTRTYKHGGKKY